MILARKDISKPNRRIKYCPGHPRPTPDIILRLAATQQGAQRPRNREFRTDSARATALSEHFLHRGGAFYSAGEGGRQRGGGRLSMKASIPARPSSLPKLEEIAFEATS